MSSQKNCVRRVGVTSELSEGGAAELRLNRAQFGAVGQWDDQSKY